DDRADDHLLPEGGDVEEVEAVADDGEDERADEGAEGPSGATGQTRPADDDGGDRVELVAGGSLGLSGGEPSGEDEAGDRGVEAGEGVDDELLPVDVDTGEARGLLVAADGVHRPAGVGAVEDEPGEQAECDHDEHGYGQPAPDGAAQPGDLLGLGAVGPGGGGGRAVAADDRRPAAGAGGVGDEPGEEAEGDRDARGWGQEPPDGRPKRGGGLGLAERRAAG